MGTQRITVTLPDRIAERLRRESRETGKPVSRLVAEALREQEEEEIRQKMIEGYKAMSEENRRFAEEALPLFREVLDDD